MSNYLFISDAAKEVKVESHVLRYWEEELHLPIKRNELGHRYYTEEDVERFKQIKSMKERGLQLKAIKMILKDGKLDVLSTEETGTNGAMRLNQAGGEDQAAGMNVGGQTTGFARQQADMPEEGFAQSELSKTERTRREMAAAMQSGGRMPQPGRGTGQGQQSGVGKKYRETRATEASGGLAIDIISTKEKEPTVQESREDKSRRLQWLLQQLIRQTLQENNVELCREIRDSVVKELDYQFRMQEEREETRDRMMEQRQEEHFKRMDELIRKKSRRLRKMKQEKEEKAWASGGQEHEDGRKSRAWGKKEQQNKEQKNREPSESGQWDKGGQAEYDWGNEQDEWNKSVQDTAWGANGQENVEWEGRKHESGAKRNGREEKKNRKIKFGRNINERSRDRKNGEELLKSAEEEEADLEEKKKKFF